MICHLQDIVHTESIIIPMNWSLFGKFGPRLDIASMTIFCGCLVANLITADCEFDFNVLIHKYIHEASCTRVYFNYAPLVA